MGVGARSVDYGAQGAVHSVSAIMAKGMRIVVFTANIRVLRQTGSAAGDSKHKANQVFTTYGVPYIDN